MGAVSACGMGVEALWSSARDGRSGVRDIDFPVLTRQQVGKAAAITPDTIEAASEGSQPRFQDRFAVLALAAASEAVAQAGLEAEHFGTACGVVIGSGYGGAATNDSGATQFGREPYGRMDPMSIPKVMTNAAASWVGIRYGARGPTFCISTACSSAAQSIGTAAHMIRHGMMERCLAGGSEALLVPSVFRAWELMRVMSAKLCRPFSVDRDGMVLGDGAGVLVLESLDAAQARGAAVIAELAGYGTTGDAGDLLRPDPDGAAASMAAAIADAGLAPDAIGYVNAHGTATVANDISEAEAMRRVFGGHMDRVRVSSTKPIHGHALGAAGALELIVAVKALAERTAPPTINFTTVDPKIGLEPVPNVAQPFDGDAVMSNSFAFGGINASLVARRFSA